MIIFYVDDTLLISSDVTLKFSTSARVTVDNLFVAALKSMMAITVDKIT
jgi:hypothetical protein